MFKDKENYFKELLSGDEIKRLEKFYFQFHRLSFLVAHGILRELIGRYINISPKQVKFNFNDYGKPKLFFPKDTERVYFNIFHSGNIAVLAFSKYSNIGVDVEFIRDIPDVLDIVENYFHSQEKDIFLSILESQQQEIFFSVGLKKRLL